MHPGGFGPNPKKSPKISLIFCYYFNFLPDNKAEPASPLFGERGESFGITSSFFLGSSGLVEIRLTAAVALGGEVTTYLDFGFASELCCFCNYGFLLLAPGDPGSAADLRTGSLGFSGSLSTWN